MTDDLTKRLRDDADVLEKHGLRQGFVDWPHIAKRFREAADELDTLRAKLAEAEAQLPRGIRDGRFSADKRTTLGEQP